MDESTCQCNDKTIAGTCCLISAVNFYPEDEGNNHLRNNAMSTEEAGSSSKTCDWYSGGIGSYLGRDTILTDISHGFIQPLQANAGIVPWN
jgi:hypothetical protein